MSASDCSFCNHPNPAGAKFCNACGSPLTLKPCARCEAVNEAAAAACYKCGADLREGSMAAAPAPEAPIDGGASADGFQDDHGQHKPLPESAADMLAGSPVLPTLEASRSGQRTAVATRVPGDWREHVVETLSMRRRFTGPAGAATESRSPWAGALLISVITIVLTTSTYYVYLQPGGIASRLDRLSTAAARTLPISEAAHARGPADPSPARQASLGNAAGPLPPAGPDSTSNVDATKSMPDVGAPQSGEQPAAPASSGDHGATPSAADSGVGATRTQDASDTARATGVEAEAASRQRAAQYSMSARRPARSPATIARVPLGERSTSRREAPSISQCTDAVAALGLCTRQ